MTEQYPASSLFLWKTCRPKLPSLRQWFMASHAMSVRLLSMASCVISGSCTQCGQPHSTWPSRNVAITPRRSSSEEASGGVMPEA